MLNCNFCNKELKQRNGICKFCKLSNLPRILVDFEIKKLLEEEQIEILPILNMKEQISPFGFDLTLDTKFKKVIKTDNKYLDPILKPTSSSQYYEPVELLLGNKDDNYILHPGDFALGQSYEFIVLPDFIVGGLDGKSSLGRLGVTVHTTAASIDPGFRGHITFELYNAGSLPVILHPLQPVAKLILHLTEKAKKPYKGKYSAQTEVRASQYHESAFSKILSKQTKSIP